MCLVQNTGSAAATSLLRRRGRPTQPVDLSVSLPDLSDLPEPPTADDIDTAARRIRGYVRRTPVIELAADDLGISGGARIALKLETLQHTGSFKPRGAFNRILSARVPAAGILAASGGNHAQAVAWAGSRLGHATEIFVPESAPAIKVSRLHRLGARVVQIGQLYDEAREASERRAAESGALVVHAYDQHEIVAGAGTLARELEGQLPRLDTILVAVGGGGLIGGTLAWLRGRKKVVAVEPRACPTLHEALAAGEPVDVSVGGIAADALAARRIGRIPFAAARRWLADSLLVEDADILGAQRLLWERLRVVAEPGGATALAALLAGTYRPSEGEHVCALVCGANVDPATVAG